MPKLRRLSGDEVIRILEHFGFVVHAQRGSHVKLRRIGPAGEKQTLTIPRHRELDTGTLRAIFRQASRYISTDELRPEFYTRADSQQG
jgi:predicted RNA binding protein YcfA (HicA-like mRNA interferase family)